MFFGPSVGLIGGLVLLFVLFVIPSVVIPLDDRMWERHKVIHH